MSRFNTDHWKEMMKIIHGECKGMPLWYSAELGWCYITDRNSVRHKVDHTMNEVQVREVIKKAKLKVFARAY